MKPPDPGRGPRIVLFVVNDPRFFITHRMGLAQGVRASGYDVHVAIPDERNDVATIEAAGFPVHRVPIDRQGLNPIADLRTVFELWRLYRHLRPSIVHHVTIKPVLYGSLAARLANVPSVVNAISGLGLMFAAGSRIASLRAAAVRVAYRLFLSHPNSRVIFQNEEDRAIFVRASIVSVEHTALIVGSGVELGAFAPDAEPDDPPIVVLPARFLRQKGIREFAEAAGILRAEGMAARFVLVGDFAENRDAVSQSDLDRWCADGVIENWGWTDDMPSVIARSSIVCLPSYYREGVPKALLDGCAGGRPLITTDMPGCRDVVDDGVNGYVIPPRDVPALVTALRRLLLDPAARRRMGRKAREIAEARYALQSVIDATRQCYHALEAADDAVSSPLVLRASSQGGGDNVPTVPKTTR